MEQYTLSAMLVIQSHAFLDRDCVPDGIGGRSSNLKMEPETCQDRKMKQSVQQDLQLEEPAPR